MISKKVKVLTALITVGPTLVVLKSSVEFLKELSVQIQDFGEDLEETITEIIRGDEDE